METTESQIIFNVIKRLFNQELPYELADDDEALMKYIKSVVPNVKTDIQNEIERLKEENNSLRMDNMTHEYNDAERERFAPEFERQIREDERQKILTEYGLDFF